MVSNKTYQVRAQDFDKDVLKLVNERRGEVLNLPPIPKMCKSTMKKIEKQFGVQTKKAEVGTAAR